MNTKIIAAQFFSIGRFLQDQLLPELLKRFRQHNVIPLYIESTINLCYRWAILCDSTLAEAHYRLGFILSKNKTYTEASICFSKAIENGCYNLFGAYFHLGRMLFKLKQFEASIAAFHHATNLKPNHVWSSILLGDVFTAKCDIYGAIRAYQSASIKQLRKTHPHFVSKPDNVQQSSAPSFLIIGQVKCGTTSLYTYLTQHPQILPAIKKEIFFWNRRLNFDRGLDWYLAHFPTISAEQNFITGEATVDYLDYWETIPRLFHSIESWSQASQDKSIASI